VCPDAVGRLEELSNTIIASLCGIEERVDYGWILLRDLVAQAGKLDLAFKVYVTVPGPEKNLEVVLTKDRETDTNSLTFFATGPLGDPSGLFTRLLAPEQQRSRFEAQKEGLPVDQVPEPPPPPEPKPLFGLLQIPESFAERELRVALHQRMEPERLAIEQFGLAPIEPGGLRAPPSPGWLSWKTASDPAKTNTAKSWCVTSDLHLLPETVGEAWTTSSAQTLTTRAPPPCNRSIYREAPG